MENWILKGPKVRQQFQFHNFLNVLLDSLKKLKALPNKILTNHCRRLLTNVLQSKRKRKLGTKSPKSWISQYTLCTVKSLPSSLNRWLAIVRVVAKQSRRIEVDNHLSLDDFLNLSHIVHNLPQTTLSNNGASTPVHPISNFHTLSNSR